MCRIDNFGEGEAGVEEGLVEGQAGGDRNLLGVMQGGAGRDEAG